jgi:hypothetical protein
MRSRQTGQVGSSINDGVGGANGFVASGEEVADMAGVWVDGCNRTGLVVITPEGVNGSLFMLGNLLSVPEGPTWISTVFTKTT